MPDQFRGPIFGWRFPLLNSLLSLLSGRATSVPGVRASNLEHWKIVKDASGDITDVIVKRDFTRKGD